MNSQNVVLIIRFNSIRIQIVFRFESKLSCEGHELHTELILIRFSVGAPGVISSLNQSTLLLLILFYEVKLVSFEQTVS